MFDFFIKEWQFLFKTQKWFSSNRHTFKCPYCHSTNLTSADLIDHCNKYHPDDEKQMVKSFAFDLDSVTF